jgi:hypothetical protein
MLSLFASLNIYALLGELGGLVGGLFSHLPTLPFGL